jgi:AraC-like DNA-binding protein
MRDAHVDDGAGSTFHEVPPPSRLRDVVWSLWVQQVPAHSEPYSHRTVPDGGVHLLHRLGGGLDVRGPRTRPSVEILEPGLTIIGVRLRPGVASGLLRVSARDLRDAHVAIEDVPGRWGMLSDRLAAATSPRQALAAFVDQLAMEAASGVAPDPIVQRCVRSLLPHGAGGVGEAASDAGVSERYLRRLFDVHVGVSPKVLQGVLRLQGVLADIQTSLTGPERRGATTDLASLAARHGYFDQAHLTHEFGRLVGATPGEFVARTERECGLHHDHAAGVLPLGVEQGRPVP